MDRFAQDILVISLLLCILSVPICAESINGEFKAENQYDVDSMIIKGGINDYAEIISADDKLAIQSALSDLSDEGSFNFMIITVGSLQGKNIDRFAKNILEKKFGDVPYGAILYVFSLDDRKYSFYIGNGVSVKIPKSFIERIGKDSATSFFSRGEYSKGILDVVNKFHEAVFNGSDMLVQEESQEKSRLNATVISFFKWSIIIFVIVMVLLIVVANIISFRKSIYSKKNLSTISEQKDDEYFSAANLASTLFARELEKSGGYKKEKGF